DQPGTLAVSAQVEHLRDRGVCDRPGHPGRLGCQIQRGTSRRPFDETPVRAATHLEGQCVLVPPDQPYPAVRGELSDHRRRRSGPPRTVITHPITVPRAAGSTAAPCYMYPAGEGTAPSSAAVADPHRYLGGLQSL